MEDRFPSRIDALSGIASEQSGYFTRAQANGKGVDDIDLTRLTKSGRLRRVAHGVYAFDGAPAHPHETLFAAWLRLEPGRLAFERLRHPDAVVSGLSAAVVYGIGDLAASEHTFIVQERRRAPEGVRLRKGDVQRRDWEVVQSLPVLRPHRVIATLFREHADRGHLEDMAVDALAKSLMRNEELASAMRDEHASSTEVDRFLERVGRRTRRGLRELEVSVIDGDRQPIAGATVLASAPNATFKTGITNQDGMAVIAVVEGRPYTLFVASPGHYSVVDSVAADEDEAVIEMAEANYGGGSVIFENGSGYIPVLSGRLNPKKDTSGRTYIYADNIAIEDGAPQPFPFGFDDWFELEDADGVEARVCVRDIRGRSCVLDYEVEIRNGQR